MLTLDSNILTTVCGSTAAAAAAADAASSCDSAFVSPFFQNMGEDPARGNQSATRILDHIDPRWKVDTLQRCYPDLKLPSYGS